MLDRAVTRYHLVFVCDIDIPYVDTWDRSGEDSRVTFQQQIIDDLHKRKVPYIMLHGNLEQRVARVHSALELFEGSRE